MIGRCDILPLVAEFLEELFARAEAGKLDFDVLLRPQPAELDQLSGEIYNFDGLAHIQHKNFPTSPLAGSLQDQSRGLRNCHEVARDIRMCNFDRSAGSDLSLKGRNNASGGTQDISKTDSNKAGGSPISSGVGLQKNFSQTLARPHYIRGIDRFVSGNKDEIVNVEFRRKFSQKRRAKTVVSQRLARLLFHHGNVLMSCGMKDDLWMKTIENVTHASLVENISDQRQNNAAKAALDQLLLNLKCLKFRLIDQQQAFWIERRDLPAKLTSDTSTGASYHYHASNKELADIFGFQFHRIPSKKIRDLHVPKLAYLDLSGGKLIQ